MKRADAAPDDETLGVVAELRDGHGRLLDPDTWRPVAEPAPLTRQALVAALRGLSAKERREIMAEAGRPAPRRRGRPTLHAPAGGPIGRMLKEMARQHRRRPRAPDYTLAAEAMENAGDDLDDALRNRTEKALRALLVALWRRDRAILLRWQDALPRRMLAARRELKMLEKVQTAGINPDLPWSAALRQLRAGRPRK